MKEVSERIRRARKRWEAHENGACREERKRALEAYEALTGQEREAIPEVLRTWLRYRSEKYFGSGTRGNGMKPGAKKASRAKAEARAPQHAIASRRVKGPFGSLFLLSSSKGLCGLFFGHRINRASLPKENRRDRFLNQAEEELAEYFGKRRRTFKVALDFKGSAFQKQVWRQLCKIPFGETQGYGELAEEIGNPKAVRAVGTANGANPISIIVPCHRVIGKDGSLVGFGGGLEIKSALLRHEGLLL